MPLYHSPVTGRIALFLMVGMLTLGTSVVLAASATDARVQGQEDVNNRSVPLRIEGISASVGEDEPRVLTILPWRAPTLSRRPRAELERRAPELVEPLDALVLERHRAFRQSLGVVSAGGQPGARR